jgi:HEAT repeat protein
MTNWKFWTWLAQIDDAEVLLCARRAEIESLKERLIEESGQRARNLAVFMDREDACQEAETATKAFTAHLEKWRGLPRADRDKLRADVVAALAGLGEEHPVWKAINALMTVHLDVERRAAKQYGTGTDAALRDFNSGREAGLEDFRAALWKLHHEGRTPKE